MQFLVLLSGIIAKPDYALLAWTRMPRCCPGIFPARQPHGILRAGLVRSALTPGCPGPGYRRFIQKRLQLAD